MLESPQEVIPFGQRFRGNAIFASLFDLGLTMGELNFLALIDQGYRLNRQLALHVGCSRLAAEQLVHRLRKKGLIKGDRYAGLSISPDGAAALQAVRRFLSGKA